MAAKDNLTKSANISVTAREVDFVTRFARNWEALREIMGIMRPIKKENGTQLKSKVASVVLQSGSVAEGDEIPYSLASVSEVNLGNITFEKYAKAVSIEAVADHGAEVAINKTDEEFLNELQGNVMTRFYNFLGTGRLTAIYTTWQMAVAMAIGLVKDKFKKMRKSSTSISLFVNTIDAYAYLGAAGITVQNAFGIDYVKNFMGASTVILSSEIASGKVIATPSENIVMYYIDPTNSGFAQLGLDYRTDGETNLIGFHAGGNYERAVGECHAIVGVDLFAEYLDGIAVVSVQASGSLGVVSASSGAATTTTGATKITVSSPTLTGDQTAWFKADSSAAPSVSYLDQLDSTWTQLVLGEGQVADNVKPTGLASADKATVVICNGAGQAVASGTIASITVKA